MIGFVAAFGALGGVGINLALRQSYLATGTDTLALWAFLLFYIVAAVVTWARYVRRHAAEDASVPGTHAHAEPARV